MTLAFALLSGRLITFQHRAAGIQGGTVHGDLVSTDEQQSNLPSDLSMKGQP